LEGFGGVAWGTEQNPEMEAQTIEDF